MADNEEERTLTDADIDAILDRASKRFRINVGTGVIDLAWRAIILAIIGLAVWGVTKGNG